MRVFIIGTGAMGCLYGAWLSTCTDVTLYNKRVEPVAVIQKNGVRVEGLDGNPRIYTPTAIAQSDQFDGGADLVIIFTKSYATRDASLVATKVIAPDGVVLTLQNGLGNKEQIDTILKRKATIAGVTAQAATTLGPGITRHCGEGETIIGGSLAQAEKLDRIQQLFEHCGITTRIHTNTESLIWGKLIINVGINALAALLQVPNGTLAKSPECRCIMTQAVEEAVAVAKALDIPLPYDNPLEEVIKVCQKTAENRASMLQDILRHAQTEIDVINGAIVTKGKECGIATPVNLCIRDIIKAMEATYAMKINEFQH